MRLISFISTLLAFCAITSHALSVPSGLAEGEVTPAPAAAVWHIRAVPFGDSITFGVGSSTGNSYRGPLQQLILANNVGNTLDFIGSVRSGTMSDPDNEGHSGFIIDQIATFVDADLALKPNVVLILAGTNDINRNIDVANAPARLMAMVDKIVAALPTAVVLVGTLPLNGDPTHEALNNQFNAAITLQLQARALTGKRVITVSLEGLVAADMADGLHPNDQGYVKMANAYFAGLSQASALNWITEPA